MGENGGVWLLLFFLMLFASLGLVYSASVYFDYRERADSFLGGGLVNKQVYERFEPEHVVIKSYFESNWNSTRLRGLSVPSKEGFKIPSNLVVGTVSGQDCLIENVSLDYFWLVSDGSVVPVLRCDFNCSDHELLGLSFSQAGLLANASKIFVSREAVASDYWLTLFHEQCHQLVARGFLSLKTESMVNGEATYFFVDEEKFCDDYANERFEKVLNEIIEGR